MTRTTLAAFAIASFSVLAPLPTGAASIAVGTYTPSTTQPFLVPVDITNGVDVTFFQFDLLYDAADVQINTACDPFSDPACGLFTGPVTEGPFFGSLSPFNLFNPGFVLLDGGGAQIGDLLAVNGTYGGALPGPSGIGTLAFVEFVTTASGTGTSAITVTNASIVGGAVAAVPEPGTLALIAGGLLFLGRRRTAQATLTKSLAGSDVAVNRP